MLNQRSACLGGHPCEPEGFKEVLHCAAHHHPTKALPQVAEEIGRKAQQLRDETNPNEPDWLPSRLIPALAAATKGRPLIAQHIAKLQGGLFVPLPTSYDGVESELFAATAEVMKQLGEACDVIRQKLADKQITRDEVPAIHTEIDDIMIAAHALKAAVDRNAVDVPAKRSPLVAVGGSR